MSLDLFTTLLGLLYIFLEYRASILLWFVGILMPLLDIWLYYSYGLYGDAALAVYYTLAHVYGIVTWLLYRKRNQQSKSMVEMPVTYMPRRQYLPVALVFLAAWGATSWILKEFTNSTVPVLDGFTNALSIIGMWALAKKYVQQWVFWIVVDVVSSYLYVIKGIPFKAGLYGLYVIIAFAGLRKWMKLAQGARCQ